MSNAHKVHGVVISTNGHQYTSTETVKDVASDADATNLAKRMVMPGNSEFNLSKLREIPKDSILRFDLTGAAGTSYLVVFLHQLKDKFLTGEPVRNFPIMVMGDMKSFFTLVSCSAKHVILKVDMAEVREQSKRITDVDAGHAIVTLPICLNLVNETFNTSMPILGHPNKDDDHDHPNSIESILGHGGFHPPVAYVQV